VGKGLSAMADNITLSETDHEESSTLVEVAAYTTP
jgi:hypothetical protein